MQENTLPCKVTIGQLGGVHLLGYFETKRNNVCIPFLKPLNKKNGGHLEIW